MNDITFFNLTGELPEDVLGDNWEKEIKDWNELDVPTFMREDEQERIHEENIQDHLMSEYLLSIPEDPEKDYE